jgi:predicted TPR repeat methyltransferase
VVHLARAAGAIAADTGDLEAAASYYRDVVALQRDDGWTAFALGEVERRRGNVIEARAAFADALRIASDGGDEGLAKLASRALDS